MYFVGSVFVGEILTEKMYPPAVIMRNKCVHPAVWHNKKKPRTDRDLVANHNDNVFPK